MNEKDHREEDDVERLIRAGFDKESRPAPAAREQAWTRVKAAWKADYATTAASASSAAPSGAAATADEADSSRLEKIRSSADIMRTIVVPRSLLGSCPIMHLFPHPILHLFATL